MTASYPRVLPVGDRAVTVELGASLDEETVGRVRALDARLTERDLPGVLETVPTYASLMLLYDRALVSFADLSRLVLELAQDLESSALHGRELEIPALYDGPDLDEVARTLGLSREAVVEIHAAREYRVMMLGFSPGFGYMGFVDDRLRLPRRTTPRTRVPSGSIAIAAAQTGIYPRALPGGWNLLGRTNVRLFDSTVTNADPGAGPSFLMPGDRVRFNPVSSLDPETPSPDVRFEGSGVRVEDAGVLTAIQDAGRAGFRRLAVPFAGYADPAAARMANLSVGNSPDAPVIEICAPGLRLRFERATYIALAGATLEAALERGDLETGAMSVPPNVAVRVRASNVLSVNGLRDGVRAYVAIAGLESPRVLGSASADLGSGFLRPLANGDGLSIGGFDADRVRRDALRGAVRRATVRVVKGPQLHHFDEATLEAFFATPWKVGLDSDRVGARLDGPRLSHAGPKEIVSDGMVPGCVQVPPDGRPIVMLSDCPTTGGYPKIGCVVTDDLATLAQAIPGRTEIRFEAVRIEDL